MKISLNEAIDILMRRARDLIYSDKVFSVYATMNDDSVAFTFILDRNVTGIERAKLCTKYVHLFDDVSDTYRVDVLNAENNFTPSKNTYMFYEQGAGFSVTPRMRETNRNF